MCKYFIALKLDVEQAEVIAAIASLCALSWDLSHMFSFTRLVVYSKSV